MANLLRLLFNKIRFSALAEYSVIGITILVAAYFLYLHIFQLSVVAKLGVDAVSWVLPAHAQYTGMGVAYADYWDIKPPGLIFMTQIWMMIFGTGMHSFHLLHFLLVLISLVCMLWVLYKVFPRYIASWLSLVTTFIFFSPRLQTQLLASELYGLVYSLLGLATLLTNRFSVFQKIFISTALFVVSGQMKDPFALTVASVFPFIFYIYIHKREKLRKSIAALIAGIFVPLFILIACLFLLENLQAYLEILEEKQRLFSVANIEKVLPRLHPGLEFPRLTFLYLPYSLTYLILLSGLGYISARFITGDWGFQSDSREGVRFRAQFTLSELRLHQLIVFTYSIFSVIGFAVQSKFGQHYDIQMVFPILVLVSLSTLVLYSAASRLIVQTRLEKFPTIFVILSLASIVVLTFPKKEYLIEQPYMAATPQNAFSRLFTLDSRGDFTLEQEIQKATEPGECIMQVYGWGVGSTYFYSQRQPCTRHFIPNMVPPDRKDEYAEALIKKPPAAIIYERGNADLNLEEFEAEVFNYPAVLEHCYELQSRSSVYLPRFAGEAQQSCLRAHH